MTSFRIGKFEIGQQQGVAGEVGIGHKYVEQHTGRNPYMKQVRATLTDPKASVEAIETLTVTGKKPFLTLETESSDISYNVQQVTINATSNAEKFRVATTGKAITLKPNAGYTVAENIGTFTDGFGLSNQGAVAAIVSFATNATAAVQDIPVKMEYWDGSAWQACGTHTIHQSSSDTEVHFTLDPTTVNPFTKAGGSVRVAVLSNMAYSIEKQGGSDVSWLTLDRTEGVASEVPTDLNITVAAQAVGADARNANIVFKSQITGSVIGTLFISETVGEAFAISWQNASISFTNDEVGTIKNNTLTANAAWALEEVIPQA